MVSAEFFDEIERMVRDIRRSHAPFGGVQLILSGDFFQCAFSRTPCPDRSGASLLCHFFSRRHQASEDGTHSTHC